ncbi:VanZ family protein [Kitasatospora sp. NPDC101801]|uniref:VanZ family protein n=1 Tax=Kitasatospora sp. NPDC101801 TaxID=3364103 RepID=UPI0038002C5F
MTDQANPSHPAPEVSPRLRLPGILLLAGYLGLIGWLILRPLAVGWTSPANLTPFASVRLAFSAGGPDGLRQLAGGLLPLAPLGVLLPLADGRLRVGWLPSLLRTAGCSALIATALEILKGWAPGHVLNVDDIVLGILGVVVCHLVVVPFARARLVGHATPRPGRERAAVRPRGPLNSLAPQGSSAQR